MSRQEGNSGTKGQRDKGTKQKTLIHLIPLCLPHGSKTKLRAGVIPEDDKRMGKGPIVRHLERA